MEVVSLVLQDSIVQIKQTRQLLVIQDLTVLLARHLVLNVQLCRIVPQQHQTMLQHAQMENTQKQVGPSAPSAPLVMVAQVGSIQHAQRVPSNTRLAAKPLVLQQLMGINLLILPQLLSNAAVATIQMQVPPLFA